MEPGKYVVLIFLLFSGLPAFGETLATDNNEYVSEVKESVLACSLFSIKSYTTSFPASMEEKKIPREESMGHLGNPRLISHDLYFKLASTSRKIPELYELLKDYDKIDKNRPYVATPVKCIENDRVLFSLWGGGNCDTVCEAYAIVEFTFAGIVSDIKGLTYQEYMSYKSK